MIWKMGMACLRDKNACLGWRKKRNGINGHGQRKPTETGCQQKERKNECGGRRTPAVEDIRWGLRGERMTMQRRVDGASGRGD